MAKRSIADTFVGELQEQSLQKSSRPERTFLPCHLAMLEALATQHSLAMPCVTGELRHLIDAAPQMATARSAAAAFEQDLRFLRTHTPALAFDQAAREGTEGREGREAGAVEEVSLPFLRGPTSSKWRPLPAVFVHNLLRHEQLAAENQLRDRCKQFGTAAAAVRQTASMAQAAVAHGSRQPQPASHQRASWDEIAARGMHANLLKRLATSLEDVLPPPLPPTAPATATAAAPATATTTRTKSGNSKTS